MKGEAFAVKLSNMLLTYTLKLRGLRTEPCAVPEKDLRSFSVHVFLSNTNISLYLNKENKILQVCGSIPIDLYCDIRSSMLTASNAFQ